MIDVVGGVGLVCGMLCDVFMLFDENGVLFVIVDCVFVDVLCGFDWLWLLVSLCDVWGMCCEVWFVGYVLFE